MTEEQMLVDRCFRAWKVMMHNLLRACLLKYQEESGHRIAWLVFPLVGDVRNYG